MGLFGGGNSSSKNTKSTIGNDGRTAVQDGTGISLNLGSVSKSNVGNINIKTTDQGAIKKALDANANALNKAISANSSTIDKTLAAITKSDALNGQGFDKLLELADEFFSGAASSMQSSADKTLEGIKSIATAQNDTRGDLDQKTILLAGVLVVAGLWAWKRG